jgi:phage portal protein BeeE
VKFEVDGLLRADAKTRAEIYALGLDPVSGWISRDEVRQLEDLPPESGAAPATANGNGTPTNVEAIIANANN